MAIESQQAERALKIIADSLEQGKDFVLDQAPDVVQQLIAWKRTETVVAIVLGIAAIAVCLLVVRDIRLSYASAVENRREEDPTFILSVIARGIMAVLLAVVGMVIVGQNLSVCLQVWIAPKVFVLQYLASIAI